MTVLFAYLVSNRSSPHIRNRIRKWALLKAELILSETATPAAQDDDMHTDLRRNAFREAARQGWQKGAPRPIIKTSDQPQTASDPQEDFDHVDRARKFIEQLDEYDEHAKLTMDEMIESGFGVKRGDEDGKDDEDIGKNEVGEAKSGGWEAAVEIRDSR